MGTNGSQFTRIVEPSDTSFFISIINLHHYSRAKLILESDSLFPAWISGQFVRQRLFVQLIRAPQIRAPFANTACNQRRLHLDEQITHHRGRACVEPNWSKTPYAHASELPALQWKLLNLRKLRDSHAKRFAAQHDELRKRLEQHEMR